MSGLAQDKLQGVVAADQLLAVHPPAPASFLRDAAEDALTDNR
ncbi:hypothetical protein T261_7701 [Streptomyces lydicus]|nr:hypothetical protein T261_7701 [Streptomyces lydicus]